MRRSVYARRAAGQSVVLVALAIVVLIAVAGLGMDGANAFNQRRNVVNAVDAAAMAGTSALIKQRKAGGSNSVLYTTIEEYLQNHGIDTAENTWHAYYVDSGGAQGAEITDDSTSVSLDARGVAIDLSYSFDTMFMPVLGQNSLTIGGAATAMFGPASTFSGSDLVPFVVSEAGVAALLAQNDGQGAEINTIKLGAGNFGSVSFNPDLSGITVGGDCAASPYTDSLSHYWCNGSPVYPVYIGEQLWVKPGAVATSLADEIETRMGKIMIMPIFSGNAGTGANAQMMIVGFMAVKLTAIDVTGPVEDRSFTVDYVGDVTTTGSFNPNGADGGVYAVNLVE